MAFRFIGTCAYFESSNDLSERLLDKCHWAIILSGFSFRCSHHLSSTSTLLVLSRCFTLRLNLTLGSSTWLAAYPTDTTTLTILSHLAMLTNLATWALLPTLSLQILSSSRGVLTNHVLIELHFHRSMLPTLNLLTLQGVEHLNLPLPHYLSLLQWCITLTSLLLLA
jgi:hypothetical protein